MKKGIKRSKLSLFTLKGNQGKKVKNENLVLGSTQVTRNRSTYDLDLVSCRFVVYMIVLHFLSIILNFLEYKVLASPMFLIAKVECKTGLAFLAKSSS